MSSAKTNTTTSVTHATLNSVTFTTTTTSTASTNDDRVVEVAPTRDASRETSAITTSSESPVVPVSKNSTEGTHKASACAPEGTRTSVVQQDITNVQRGNDDDDDNGDDAGGAVVTFPSFDAMNLPEPLLRGVFSRGFVDPSPIQARAIVPMMQGRDVVAQAQSGTGKTGAFGIGLLSRVDESQACLQALVLVPTRELAMQVEYEVAEFAVHMPRLAVRACIGGTNAREEAQRLRTGTTHVIVATPGRALDMVERGALRTEHVRVFVLDEADELLSRDFAEQIKQVFVQLPAGVQACVFSATFPDSALALTQRFLRNPLRIIVKAEALTLEGIRQFFVELDSEDEKADTLVDLLESLRWSTVVVFVNSARRAELVAKRLERDDFPVAFLHGQLDTRVRLHTMDRFRRGDVRILVATDVLARGIDVQQTSFVVNVDLPRSLETYLHRCGRCARYGRKGVTIALATQRDHAMLHDVCRFYSTHIEPLPASFAQLL